MDTIEVLDRESVEKRFSREGVVGQKKDTPSMAFSDYKSLAQVQTEFQITYQEASFLAALDLEPSPLFLREFEFSLKYIDVYTSEASRTETIIFPILREAYKPYCEKYALWIQKAMVFDDKLGGTPDYLVSARSMLGKTVLEKPLVMIVEAKKNDFEQGWGQCLAELVAAQKINGNATFPIHGVVTDGKHWEFGKLQNQLFVKNTEEYTVNQLGRLFGAIDQIFQSLVNLDLTQGPNA